MAGTHETYSLGINVNYGSVNKAEHALGAVYTSLGKVGERADRLHMPSALPIEINHIDTVTASYIQRLESEGRTYQANLQKVKVYQSAVSELSNKQRALQNDLTKIAESSGKASDAYRLQKVRINETATELSHFKSGIQATQTELRSSNPTFFDKIKSKLVGVNHEAKDTHTTFKDMFMGSALGGAVSNALSSVTSQIGGAVKQGMNLNAAVGKINSRFQAMGMSARQVRSLDSQLGELKANTAMTGDNVAILQTRMLSWSTIGTKGAMEMAKTMAGIGDSSKLNGDQVEQLSGQLMRLGATGKVTGASLSRITRNAPTFYATLAKGAGMSQSRLKSLLSSGKVTEQQFQTWMAQASKYSDTAFKSFGETQAGAMNYIKVKWQGLSQEMTKPLFDAKTSGLQSLKSILTSKELTNGAKAIGNGIAASVEYLDKHKKDISDSLKDIVNISVILGKDIWKNVASIIGNIGKAFGLVNKNAKGDGLHQFAQGLGNLSKNKAALKTISNLITAALALKGLKLATGFADPFISIGKKGVKSVQAINGFAKGVKGVTSAEDLKKMSDVGQNFYGWGDSIKTSAGKLKDFFAGLKPLVPKATALGKKIGNALTKGVKASVKLGMDKRFATGVLAGAAVATPEAMSAIKDRHSANKRSQDIGGAVGAMAGGTLTSMIPVVGPLLAPVGAIIGKYAGRWGGHAVNQFTKGWQKNKPPKNFWSMQNLGWSTHNMFKQIGSGWNHFWAGMGDWRKKQAKGIGQWANSVGRGWSRGVKGVKTWFKNIPSNLGKTGNHIKTWAGRVGNNIHKGWNKGVKVSHSFFKNLPRNMSKAGRSLQRGWNKTWKGVNNNRYVKAFKKGRFFQTALKDMRSRWNGFSKWFGKGWNAGWKSINSNRYVKAFRKGSFFQTAFKDMRSRWTAFNKWFGKGWNGFWGKTSRTARRDWNGTKRNWNNFWGTMPKKWNSFKSSFGKAWGSFWSGVGKGFSNVVEGIRSAWDNTIGDIVKAWNGMKKNLGAFGKWIFNSWTGTKNNVKGFANDISYGTGGSKHAFKYSSHAVGGYIASDHTALVGEAGPELAYRNGRDARLLGAHGPQVTKVNSGEHILNARDTARVMSGGLGNGLILRGYANGTTNLRHTSRNVTSSYNKITSDATKSLKKLTRNNISSWTKIKSDTTKQVTRLARTNNSTWTRIAKQTRKQTDRTRRDAVSDYTDMRKGVNKQTDRTRRDAVSDYTDMRKGVNKQADRTRRDAVSDYTDMRKGVHKQMDAMHGSTISLAETTSKGFGKELDRMIGYAHSAMSGTIHQINNGISGIDKVLGQFGGNTSVIKPVKFATGTDANGRLTQNTYAMINDATSGPRQEALVSDKNEVFMPRGSNVTMMIPRGWGVLNGRQTQQTGLTHFAKGSGMSHSELIKLAEKSGRDSAKSFHDMYTVNVQVQQPDIQAGMTDLAKNASTKLGNAWSNAMWTVINNAIEGGSGGPARGLLKAVEDYGEGHNYVWGAAGPSAFDCSGLVMYALRKKYGIDYPHYSASQYAMTNHISKADAKMGDLVFWGAGGSDHVGVYAGGNKYFSAESPSQGIHMNTLSSVVGKGSPLFGRVKGLKQDTGSSKNTPSKSLMALAKRELGSSALKWIENNLGDLANPAGDGVARWRKVIERAASVMHVSLTAGDLSHILTVIEHESGGNPTITNNWDSNAHAGTPSKGLIQFIDPTFQHYAVKGHRNILNGYDQLLAMFNDSTWRQNLTLGGWGPTGARRYAKGGKPPVHTPFIAGENGPELITADGPVKVDTNETTKRKVQDLANFIKFPKINRPTDSHKTSQAPTINININGPISSEKDAMKYASMIKDEVGRLLAQFAENVGDEFGSDPSVY